MNQQQQQYQVTTVTNRIYPNPYYYQSSSSSNISNNNVINSQSNNNNQSLIINNNNNNVQQTAIWTTSIPLNVGQQQQQQQYFATSSNNNRLPKKAYAPHSFNNQEGLNNNRIIINRNNINNNYYSQQQQQRSFGNNNPINIPYPPRIPSQNRFPYRTDFLPKSPQQQPMYSKFDTTKEQKQQVRFINNNQNWINNNNNNNVYLRHALGFHTSKQQQQPLNQLIDNNENIVERTKPIFRKIRKIINIGTVDMKKLLMCLESGLLAETTWALDCLHIMSNNGQLKLRTNLFIRLIEYYKCFLDTIFDNIFADTEIDYQFKLMLSDNNNNNNNKIPNNNKNNVIKSNNDRIYLLDDSKNYTFQSRNGLPVKLKNVDINVNIVKQLEYDWLDLFYDYESFNNNGNTMSTTHIIQTMDSMKEIIPFINPITGDVKNNDDDSLKQDKFIKSKKRKYEFIDDDDDNDDDEAENFESISTTLCPRLDSYESILKRLLCISNIIRNVSFLPVNCRIMAQNASFLLVISRLLSYNHQHNEKKTFEMIWNENNNLDEENNKENDMMISINELFNDYSFETLHLIRMNTFVTVSNFIDQVDLGKYSDKIILPLLDSLLHWLICPSSYARDPLPPDNLSCQLQALEIMAKLSINPTNIDLILATPPFNRIEQMYRLLVEFLGKNDDQVMQELSIIILANFAYNDILSAKIILHIDMSINNLLSFIEKNIYNQNNNDIYCLSSSKNYQQQQQQDYSINYILTLASRTLKILAKCCDHQHHQQQDSFNLFKKYENRFVNLIMSSLLLSNNNYYQNISQILADILFILSNQKSVQINDNDDDIINTK